MDQQKLMREMDTCIAQTKKEIKELEEKLINLKGYLEGLCFQKNQKVGETMCSHGISTNRRCIDCNELSKKI